MAVWNFFLKIISDFWAGFSKGHIAFNEVGFMSLPERTDWLMIMVRVGLAYLFLFVVLPLFTFRYHLKGKPLYYRFCFSFIAQVFFVVNAVFLLSLLKINNPFTMWLSVIVWSAFMGFYGRWKEIKELGANGFVTALKLFSGEYGLRLWLSKVSAWVFKKSKTVFKKLSRHILRHIPEYFLLLFFMTANLWFYSYGVLRYNSFGFGDEYTHSQWIYQIGQGNVFASGIYPLAMHCKIYAIYSMFGINLHDVALYFGIMETMMLLLGVYCFLRAISENRYIAILGVLFSSFAAYAPMLVIRRFQWSLPEECGIYLIFPAAFFLVKWLTEDEMPAIEGKFGLFSFMKKSFNRSFFTDNLLLFAMSASLVVATHFYTAITAVILCFGLILFYLTKVFSQNRIFPLVISVAAAMGATVLPYIIALLEGKYFEASIEWALNSAGVSIDSGIPLKVYVILFLLVLFLIFLASLFSWLIAKINAAFNRKGHGYLFSLAAGAAVIAFGVWVAVSPESTAGKAIRKLNFWIKDAGLLGGLWGNYLIWICKILLVAAAVYFLIGESIRAKNILALLFAYFVLVFFYCLPYFGAPMLMDQIRVSIFITVLSPIFFTCFFDVLTGFRVLRRFKALIKKILKKGEKTHSRKAIKTLKIICFETFMFLLCMGLFTVMFLGGQFHGVTEMEFTQYNAAVDCVRKIEKNYRNFSWTIISPTDELYHTVQSGFHEEILTMINAIDKNTAYTVPSEYLFFFIEKNVINYAQCLSFEKGNIISSPVSFEDAEKRFVEASFSENYNKNRSVLMSKMYYWSLEFKKRYPNEFKTFYEDDDFVCYLLRQNTYSLYNLNIKYGYKPPAN